MSRILVLVLVLAHASSVLANHNHPFKAPKFDVWFVRSYAPCAAPDVTHDAPLGFPACAPPASASPVVSFGPKGFGRAWAKVVLSPPFATDVKFCFVFGDIRNGDDGTGAPFSGTLTAMLPLRMTDHLCHGPVCTMTDIPFPIPIKCGTVNSPPLPPGKCQACVSTFNTVVPGSVVPWGVVNMGIGQITVFSGNNLAFEEGLFLPGETTTTVTSTSSTTSTTCAPAVALNVATGLSGTPGDADPLPWKITAVPAGTPGAAPPHAAVIVSNYPSWNSAPGAQWISADTACSAYPGDDCPGGIYSYELCWRQCGPATINLQVFTDNDATIFLNNQSVGTTPLTGFNTVTPVSPTDPGPGLQNCLRLDVHNEEGVSNATGIKIFGTIQGSVTVLP